MNNFEHISWVVDNAIECCLSTKDEVDLYRSLSLLVWDSENEKKYGYKMTGSGIGGGIDFSLVVPEGHPLPDFLGKLFMNIDTIFDVKITKTDLYKDREQDHFSILINDSRTKE